MNLNASKQDWMGSVVRHPGGLHRALGIPLNQTIPMAKVHAAADEGGKIGRMASLAETFHKYRP